MTRREFNVYAIVGMVLTTLPEIPRFFKPTLKTATVYKIYKPAFKLFFIDKKDKKINERFLIVHTYNSTLNELKAKYTESDIYFYSEQSIVSFINGSQTTRTYTRCHIIPKDETIVLLTKSQEIK